MDIPTSCSILFTDFKNVFVFALGRFVPVVVNFYDLQCKFTRERLKMAKKSLLEWPNVDFEVWNVSFGGTFLLKSGLGFLFRATESPFSECVKRDFYAFLRILRTPKMGFPSL